MEGLTEEQQELVKDIVRRHGVTDYDVEIKTVSGDGDGYLGILSGLNIVDKEGNKKLSLVLKLAPKSVKLRKLFPTRETFLREIYMYETLFPELQLFQNKYNVPKPFVATTKYYGSISEEFKECLVLENLKENNYKLANRREPLDSHHLSLVIGEYARLHAISFAMRKLEPDYFERTTKEIKLNVMQQFDNTKEENSLSKMPQDAFYTPIFQALEGLDKELEAVKNFCQAAFDLIFQKAFVDNGTFVIAHCDCWSTNMLFKYEDSTNNSIPTSVCFIDWQLSSLAHPIFDISYFFYICAGKKDLENYMRYLILYHTVLSDSLTSFGLDPVEIYPFDQFEKDWTKYSKQGFFMTMVMLGQSLSEKKTHDFEEMAESGDDILDFSKREKVVSDVFKERMQDLVKFLVKHDFI